MKKRKFILSLASDFKELGTFIYIIPTLELFIGKKMPIICDDGEYSFKTTMLSINWLFWSFSIGVRKYYKGHLS